MFEEPDNAVHTADGDKARQDRGHSDVEENLEVSHLIFSDSFGMSRDSGHHDDNRGHEVKQLEEELEPGLSIGLRIETNNHDIVVLHHLLVEVRFGLLKVLITLTAAHKVYHSSLQVEFSNFADQSVGNIPAIPEPPIDGKDEKCESDRSETVEESDVTERKCCRYFKS